MPLLYLGIDGFLHKGMVRVMLPKNFNQQLYLLESKNKQYLKTPNKFWTKAVNTPQALQRVDINTAGCEMDVYFDTLANTFFLHHDDNNNNQFSLDSFLVIYKNQHRPHCLWLDFKNLTSINEIAALKKISSLRLQYNLYNKIIVESRFANLLNSFADSNFFTAYYTPYSLVYSNNAAQNKQYIDSIVSQIKNNKISALSGYYFQQPILQQCFPNYPILQWQANDKYSIINWLYKCNVNKNRNIFISLLP
jgi:hypothetical protein